MLKEKTNKKGDVVVMKLMSGEELIARVEESDDTSVTVTKPLVLGLHQNPNDPNGHPIVGMAPFVFGVDETQPLHISSDKWVFKTNARKEAADQYIQSTTGIEVVKSSSIIT